MGRRRNEGEAGRGERERRWDEGWGMVGREGRREAGGGMKEGEWWGGKEGEAGGGMKGAREKKW